MGLQQSSNSVSRRDSSLVNEHIRKMESLRAEVSAMSKENNFLRRRINDLTEYSSILEDELKKTKTKSSERDQDVEKYAELCRKFEKENESLVEQNNKLLFDLFSLNDQASNITRLGKLGQSSEQNRREQIYNEKAQATIAPLLKMHKQLENLKYEVHSRKNYLLKEINVQRSSLNDAELNKLVQEHSRYNQILIEQGVFLGEKNLQQMEQTYRYVCLKNNERKIEVMKDICKIENVLDAFSEQLNNNTCESIERIEPLLSKHENLFSMELRGISFADGYQNEKMMYSDLMTKLSNELAHFRRVLPSGSDNVVKYKTGDHNVNEHLVDTNDSRNTFKGWSFDVFDEKKT